ncbi:MAG TPA: ADP-ribosylglycohydrolase family protein [Steroidobacteraceae bacterium]
MSTRRPLENSYWVLPGRLLAGEYPYGQSVAEAQQRLQRLLAAGIDAFVDLTQPGELPEYRSLLPSNVQYLRSPITDAQVPADLAQMRAIQTHLQATLAVGRRVYVHCRAGIGRTGIVMGCFLAEQGVEGAEALQQLNVLWRQSARSVVWPELPQTPEQAVFIVRWPRHRQPGAEAAVLRAMRGLRTRYLGALLGLAVGDGLGAASISGRPLGAWTDDTAMALCLAESLLQSSGFDPQDQWLRYARWQRDGHRSANGTSVGVTPATAKALARARSPAALDEASSNEAAPLSRVAPVVMYYFRKRDEAIAQAQAAAKFSDASPVVRDACRVLAVMMHAALRGEPLEQVLRPIDSMSGDHGLDPRLIAVAQSDPKQAPPPIAEPALHVLSVVRWALATGSNFRTGALKAVQLGEDADVIGAVYGQLAGALYGQSGIPASWLERLAHRELIEEIAARLLAEAPAGLPSADSGAAIG